MMELTHDSLEATFNRAKELNLKYVAVKVYMKNFPKPEVIINPIENVEDKLDYYKTAYDFYLHHNFSSGIHIADFAIGNSMEEIEQYLSEV